MAKDQMIRSVGVISGIGLTAGTMIGSGIFMSPGDVLDSSGFFSFFILVLNDLLTSYDLTLS